MPLVYPNALPASPKRSVAAVNLGSPYKPNASAPIKEYGISSCDGTIFGTYL